VALLLVAGLFLVPASAYAGRITLAWTASPDPSVTGYVVYYGVLPGVYPNSVNVGNVTSHALQGLTNGVTYYFVTRAYNAAGVLSAASNQVSGLPKVVTLPFTDDPLTPGLHTMKALHLTELRARIDVLRLTHGLTPGPWASGAVVSGLTLIRASHITELRTALNAVYAKTGRAAPPYTDSTITAGLTAIKAVHIRELRAAVQALE
jgi:hypothetical protein